MKFYKMDGAGNDFVVIDNRDGKFIPSHSMISHLCHRRFGIGADGFMTICQSNDDDVDFEMHYYNSDGFEGTMCGNGGRCIAALAYSLGIGDGQKLSFRACDGMHRAVIEDWNNEQGRGIVRLWMHDVEKNSIKKVLDGFVLDTGSPHYVQYVSSLDTYDVLNEGRRIRNMSNLFPEGVNVDFIEDGDRLRIRTYERGVEDETWACGTGVTAAAVVSHADKISARGGDFSVRFDEDEHSFCNIQLIGPVSLNFIGDIY